ncbi:abortive infection family protein [Alkalimarinus coralli]|uniref:abortive infection family protein n=1 Tax=Alkalimarinus coralli TaxID=2935863 RepID=UPI00202B823E|nr:abortive infection family protein [Alkalimarinus coralli]
MEKILKDLKNLDIDLNWYFEDSKYQHLIDSQFSSILERLKFLLRKDGLDSIGFEIDASLKNIDNITGQASYLVNVLEYELGTSLKASLTPSERVSAINDIAYHLQDMMVTSEINAYLSAFGIQTDDVSIVPSKRVYVQDLLKQVNSNVISQIICDLKLDKQGTVCSKTLIEMIKGNDLYSVISDFDRAIKSIDSDPDQAIASSSSTLESICKCILELEGEQIPKKQNISNLLSTTSKVLNLSPEDYDNAEIKRVLGGIHNVIVGIGALRTGYSSAHGHGVKRYALSARHVRMLVNSMVTYGTFMLETYLEQVERAKNI